MRLDVSIYFGVCRPGKGDSTTEVTVHPGDTIRAVKEKIASSQLIAFQEQDVLLRGRVLPEQSSVRDCGIADGSAIQLVVKASPASVAHQLEELLRARDLSLDELELLYCYRHGVGIQQTLRSVGCDLRLPEFLRKHLQCSVENGHVHRQRGDQQCAAPAKEQQPTNSGSTPTAAARPAPVDDALRSEAPGQASAPPAAGSTCLPAPDENEAPSEHCDQATAAAQYLELHNKISGRSFNSKVVQILNDVQELVSSSLFVSVDHVARGGSIGHGTAITDSVDAELVFFLKHLPPGCGDRWLPPLLRAVASSVDDRISSAGHGVVSSVRVTSDSVQVRAKGDLTVDVRFSPTFASYKEAIAALAEQDPSNRRRSSASLIKESTQFVSKQPGQVKVTIRLLKWWRNQQAWSSATMRPSDQLLELIAIYSAVQSKPADHASAVANALALMVRFDELRIVWTNFYSKDDVWAPLLRHRPLVMDPVNPFVNVADPQHFDPQELMELARTTHFTW